MNKLPTVLWWSQSIDRVEHGQLCVCVLVSFVRDEMLDSFLFERGGKAQRSMDYLYCFSGPNQTVRSIVREREVSNVQRRQLQRGQLRLRASQVRPAVCGLYGLFLRSPAL